MSNSTLWYYSNTSTYRDWTYWGYES